MNTYISSELETAYYCAADIIWLGYKDHFGMSGVLIKAAVCNREVLACKEGLIGKLTNEHQLGLTTNTDNPEDVAEALGELLQKNVTFDNTQRENFAKAHNIEHFQQSLILNYNK